MVVAPARSHNKAAHAQQVVDPKKSQTAPAKLTVVADRARRAVVVTGHSPTSVMQCSLVDDEAERARCAFNRPAD